MEAGFAAKTSVSALGRKLRKLDKGSEGGFRLAYYCPGCEDTHQISIDGRNLRWSYDGDVAAPTFSPSIRVMHKEGETACHHFVRAGRIEYLADCQHALKSQTVDLPDFPASEDWIDRD